MKLHFLPETRDRYGSDRNDDEHVLCISLLRSLAINYGTDTPAERRRTCMEITGSGEMYTRITDILASQQLIEAVNIIDFKTRQYTLYLNRELIATFNVMA